MIRRAKGCYRQESSVLSYDWYSTEEDYLTPDSVFNRSWHDCRTPSNPMPQTGGSIPLAY